MELNFAIFPVPKSSYDKDKFGKLLFMLPVY